MLRARNLDVENEDLKRRLNHVEAERDKWEVMHAVSCPSTNLKMNWLTTSLQDEVAKTKALQKQFDDLLADMDMLWFPEPSTLQQIVLHHQAAKLINVQNYLKQRRILCSCSGLPDGLPASYHS